MKYSNMKNVAEKIVMPEDMKRRIITNCKLRISQTRKDSIMKKNKMFKTYFRLLGFAKPLSRYTIPYFVFAALHALFNTFNFFGFHSGTPPQSWRLVLPSILTRGRPDLWKRSGKI